MEKKITHKKRCSIMDSINTQSSPVIPLVINGNTHRFLIDCGSQKNAVSDADPDAMSCFKPSGKVTQTSGFDGHACDTPLGTLAYEIGGRPCEDEFFVIPGKTFALFQEQTGIHLSGLLGIDFLKKYHCVIDFAEGFVTVGFSSSKE